MIHFKKDNDVFNFRTAVAIFDEGHVLLHRMRKDDFWALPGGRVEFQETSREAAIREIKEEIGVDIEVDRALWHVENFFDYEEKRYHEIGHYYLATLQGNAFKDKEREYDGLEPDQDLIYKWFPLPQLGSTALFPEFLKDGLQSLPLILETIVDRNHLLDKRHFLIDCEGIQGIPGLNASDFDFTLVGKHFMRIAEDEAHEDIYTFLKEHRGISFCTEGGSYGFDHYPIPLVCIFAHDDSGNYFGTLGGVGTVESTGHPVVFINERTGAYGVLSDCLKSFLSLVTHDSGWRDALNTSTSKVGEFSIADRQLKDEKMDCPKFVVYASKEAAARECEFYSL